MSKSLKDIFKKLNKPSNKLKMIERLLKEKESKKNDKTRELGL